MIGRLPRAALLALALAAAFALNTIATAQAPPGSLWYNGDYNHINALWNERNTFITQAAVYDDFEVTSPLGWHVTALFSENLFYGMTVTSADWEIRTGVSEGNAGTLVASGTTNSPLVTFTFHAQNEFMVEVTGLNVFLPILPQGHHYWLNVTPVGNGSGRSANSTTSGFNCVGTPCGNDDNAFWNSTFFGVFFDHTYNHGDGQNNYSMGVIGTVVPEPATVALLLCGMGALLIALRRRPTSMRAIVTALFITAALMLNMTANAQPPPGSLWYNGDWNILNALPNERNTNITQAAVYDDFDVTAPLGWNVTAAFSDNLLPPDRVITGADWEIRTGISQGNAGTLVASGTTNSPKVTFTGRGGFGLPNTWSRLPG
jgi:PEP-CTERM motif